MVENRIREASLARRMARAYEVRSAFNRDVAGRVSCSIQVRHSMFPNVDMIGVERERCNKRLDSKDDAMPPGVPVGFGLREAVKRVEK